MWQVKSWNMRPDNKVSLPLSAFLSEFSSVSLSKLKVYDAGLGHIWKGHSPRAGIVWHGSFTEDGCYFLSTSWSLEVECQYRCKEWRGRAGIGRRWGEGEKAEFASKKEEETEMQMQERRQWVRRGEKKASETRRRRRGGKKIWCKKI